MNPEYTFEKLFKFPKCTSEVSLTLIKLLHFRQCLLVSLKCIFPFTFLSDFVKTKKKFISFSLTILMKFVLKNELNSYSLSLSIEKVCGVCH